MNAETHGNVNVVYYCWMFLLLVLFPLLSYADDKIYTKEYTYYASEYDSKVSSRSNALEQVKSLLLGEVATFIKSSSMIQVTGNNSTYSEDILTVTAGITKLNILDESWNGEVYWVKAVIKLNPKDISERINDILNNEKLFKEIENERKRSERVLQEAKMLRDEVKKLKTKNELLSSLIFAQLTDELVDGEVNVKPSDIALARKLNRLGELAYHIKHLDDSVTLYSAAVRINPFYAQCYSNLALSYQKMGETDKSITISRMAIGTAAGKHAKRVRANTYYNIGRIYESYGDFKSANLNYIWANSEYPSASYQEAIMRTEYQQKGLGF